MRVYSSLLGAAVVLVACVNASSTRSDSTIVTSTPPKHDVPLQRKLRGSDETDEEERDGIKGVINSFHSMVPDHEVDKIVSEWMANDKSVEDAFVSLDRSQHILQLNAWVRFAAAKKFTAFSDEMIGEVLEVCGSDGLAKMIEAYRTVKGVKRVVFTLETKLFEFWKDKSTPLNEALSRLELDKSTDPLLRKKLLEMLVHANTKEDPNSVMVEAIDGFDDEMRVAVLEGLIKVKGTESVVESVLSHLMTSLEERDVPADTVFKLLKLDQSLDAHLRTLPFDAWVKYAAKQTPASFSDAILRKVNKIYGIEGLAKMFKAFGTGKDAEGAVLMSKTKLIESWLKKNTPMKKALSQLGLDKPTELRVRQRLLKRWFNYGKTKDNPYPAMLKAINGCDDEMRVAVLEGLIKIEGTDRVVEPALSQLMDSLEKRKASLNSVFKLLKLDQPGDPYLRILLFDEWANYAAKTPASLSNEMIGEVKEVYGLSGFVTMIKAFGTAKDAEGVVFTLETKLTESWKTESTPLNKALSQLGLDKPTTPLLRKRLLKRWFNYGKTKDNPDSAMLEAIEGCNDEVRYATFEGLKNIWGASRVVKKVEISLKTSVEEKTLDVNVVFKVAELKPPDKKPLDVNVDLEAAELKPSDKMLLDDKKALDDKKLIEFDFAEWVEYAAASPTVLSEDTIRKVIDFHGDKRFLKLFGAYLEAGRRKDADEMRRVFDKMEPPK